MFWEGWFFSFRGNNGGFIFVCCNGSQLTNTYMYFTCFDWLWGLMFTWPRKLWFIFNGYICIIYCLYTNMLLPMPWEQRGICWNHHVPLGFLNCSTLFNWTWYGGAWSWAGVLCEKIGFLSARSRSQIISIWLFTLSSELIYFCNQSYFCGRSW